MFCKYCGSEVEKDTSYCSKCGKALTENNEENNITAKIDNAPTETQIIEDVSNNIKLPKRNYKLLIRILIFLFEVAILSMNLVSCSGGTTKYNGYELLLSVIKRDGLMLQWGTYVVSSVIILYGILFIITFLKKRYIYLLCARYSFVLNVVILFTMIFYFVDKYNLLLGSYVAFVISIGIMCTSLKAYKYEKILTYSNKTDRIKSINKVIIILVVLVTVITSALYGYSLYHENKVKQQKEQDVLDFNADFSKGLFEVVGENYNLYTYFEDSKNHIVYKRNDEILDKDTSYGNASAYTFFGSLSDDKRELDIEYLSTNKNTEPYEFTVNITYDKDANTKKQVVLRRLDFDTEEVKDNIVKMIWSTVASHYNCKIGTGFEDFLMSDYHLNIANEIGSYSGTMTLGNINGSYQASFKVSLLSSPYEISYLSVTDSNGKKIDLY